GFARYLGKRSAFVAESWGVLEALKHARRLGLQAIELNIDSMAVFQVLKKDGTSSVISYLLVKNIRRLLDLNWEVK
ncbi:ribonuclease H protein, partial [Trifolium medium]|nr:ribonuclease H protein [Trifolium medium]